MSSHNHPRPISRPVSPLHPGVPHLNNKHKVTIDIAPDDALLEIFGHYVDADLDPELELGDPLAFGSTWPTLAHVCRRWRYLVFSFPHRFRLSVMYTGMKSLTEMLDVWPRLPIWIMREMWDGDSNTAYLGNIIALLESEHRDRVHSITLLNIPSRPWERIAASIQLPFPELMYLRLGIRSGDTPQVLAQDGSLLFSGIQVGPRLQSLWLSDFPFPVIPVLLLSANHLVYLNLSDIPESGYISPEAMAVFLSSMSKLVSLRLELESPIPLPGPPSHHKPPLLPTQFVLPALTDLVFNGDREYLEDLVAQINAPLLHQLEIYVYLDVIFDVPQFHRFISRTEGLKKLDRANVIFLGDGVAISLAQDTTPCYCWDLWFEIMDTESDCLLLSMAQACQSSLPPFSTLEQLDIEDDSTLPPRRKDAMANIEWLALLDPFTSVKDLSLTRDIALHVGRALQMLGTEGATEVLPALQNIFLRGVEPVGPAQDAIGKFVAARQLSGHPVAIYHQEESIWGSTVVDDQ